MDWTEEISSHNSANLGSSGIQRSTSSATVHARTLSPSSHLTTQAEVIAMRSNRVHPNRGIANGAESLGLEVSRMDRDQGVVVTLADQFHPAQALLEALRHVIGKLLG